MENKQLVRQQLYDFIGDNIGKFTEPQRKEIKKLILAHDTVGTAKNELGAIKLQQVKSKIENYLSKANKLPNLGLQVQAEVKTLKLVLSWLNSDAE